MTNKWTRLFFSALAFCTLSAISQAQTVTTITNFQDYSPYSAMVQATDGNFYGTSPGGSIGDVGTFYSVTASGTLTTICYFDFNTCSSGQYPIAPVMLANNGYLYGTTQQGGTALEGNLYKMTLGGTETNLYSFCLTTCADGDYPNYAPVQASNGELYGTTGSTVYKSNLAGTLTTIYTFCTETGCPDGIYPSALLQASDGNFYGVAGSGGANNDGTVFRLTPGGVLTTLHSFSGTTDGSSPVGGLVQSSNGKLYGITSAGGNNGTYCNDGDGGGCGTIFSITLDGTFTTLHKFNGTDGGNPNGRLLLATDGKLYGTTQWAGADTSGTLFQMGPGGVFTTLYNFCSQEFCLDGVRPMSAPMQATTGLLYGTTSEGGEQTVGVAYSLDMGLGPFVASAPTAGRATSPVILLGQNLTGTTSVTFNGVAATYTVVSDTEITTTVPAGAATGEIKVVTPSGTLNSNVPFRVVP